MTAVSLDVVICTYNNAAMLSEALRALAAQRVAKDVDWRVVVIDNNCTDATAETVARLAPSIDVPVTVVPEPRQGLTPARLRGVLSTRGRWIAFVDDDCLLDPDWIDNAAAFAREHPECGAFGGQVVLRWETPPPAYVDGFTYAFAENLRGDQPLERDWLAGAGMVLRRAALEATGWPERQFLEDRVGTRLVSGGDVEIGVRIASQFEVWYAPRCRLRHVISERRTRRPYLRRLVFGLGVSGHAIAALRWRGSTAAWWLHSAMEFARLLLAGLRCFAGDLVKGRARRDLQLSVAFAFGWGWNMCQWIGMGRAERRDRLGGFVGQATSTTGPRPDLDAAP